MAQGEGFRHITVTAAEDDDVIIHAGIAHDGDGATVPETQGDGRMETAGGRHDGAETGQETDGTVRPAVLEEPVATSASDPDGQATRPARATTDGRSPQPARSRDKRDDYRETTLEDLQSLKMPLMQKIVIIAAVLCIIGAIAYCVVFMG